MLDDASFVTPTELIKPVPSIIRDLETRFAWMEEGEMVMTDHNGMTYDHKDMRMLAGDFMIVDKEANLLISCFAASYGAKSYK